MAFEFAGFVSRNKMFAVRNWRGLSIVRKNLLAYRASHNECAWCGRTKQLQVHHRIPVWAEPLLAQVMSNFIVACFKCHLYIFHNGNFATRYERDIDELLLAHKVVKKTVENNR